MRFSLGLLAGVVALLVLLFNTVFIVHQTQQAIVLRFGVAQGEPITRPGLYIKAPFTDNVVLLDNRNLGLPVDQMTITAVDQERLEVDAFVRWRITDPERFYQSVVNIEGGRQRLASLAQSALRRVLGSVNSNAIIRTQRAQLMQAIEEQLSREAQAAVGVTIIDVRIRQAELPRTTIEQVYQRMRSERAQEAARLRAEGQEEGLRIRARADREVVEIEAEAREAAERTQGLGDGRRAEIFARAFNRDPEFAAFYRSMRAYETAIPPGTQMIIPPDGEFFRYMRNLDGRR